MYREGTSEGYRQISAAILHRAIKEWDRFGTLREPETKGGREAFENAEVLGFTTPRLELLAFFHSWWFRFLCDALDLDPRIVMRSAKVPL